MKRLLLALFATVVVIFAGAGNISAREITGARLLPVDTLFFLSIPNVPRFREEFSRSILGQMIADPELKPFLDDVWAKVDEFSESIHDEVGVSLYDLMGIPRGEMTVALVERPGLKVSPIIVLDCGESDATVPTLLKKMHDALDDGLAEHSTQDLMDVTIHVYTLKGLPAGMPFKQILYFYEDSQLVFSTEVSAIQEVIERRKGEGRDSLADNEVHQYIQERCKEESAEPSIVLFVNPAGLIDVAVKNFKQSSPRNAKSLAFLPQIGVDHLKGFGGAGFYAVGEFDSVTRFFTYAETTHGILNAFQFPATDLAPPAWVAADTDLYLCFNWDIAKAYQTFEGIADGVYGAGFTARQLDKAAEAGPGLHLKTDFLDLLDGRIHIIPTNPEEVVVEEDEDEEESATQPVLMAFGLKDAAKLKTTVAKAADFVPSHFEAREFNGETIYQLGKNWLTVASGQLFLTNDLPALEIVLRSERQPPLVESPEYKRVAQFFPPRLSFLEFSRATMLDLETIFSALEELAGEQALDGIDFEKIPPVEVFQKYLRCSGGYAVPDKKGAIYVNFQLRDAVN